MRVALFRLVVILLAAAVLGLPRAAEAQRLGSRVVALKVNVGEKTYWLENLDGTALVDRGRQHAGTLQATNEIFLDKGNVVKLYIAKANPLNYRYESKLGKLTETADYQAVSGFLKIVTTLVQTLGAPSTAGLTASDSASTDPVAAVFRKHGLEDSDAINTFFRALREHSATLAQKTAAMQGLFSLARTNQTQVKQIVCGTSAACRWELDVIGSGLTTRFDTLKAIRNDLIAMFDQTAVREHPINGALGLILAQEDATVRALGAATTFASAVSKIDLELALPSEASYDLTHDREILITRTELTLAGKDAGEGAVHTFTFRPDSPVTYGFGGMFAYSFVRDRSFSAVKEGDGLVIREKVSPGDYVGRKVAGVLSISPTRWAGTPFTPVFEIGASPENNVGLFAGIGLSPYGLFHFGGGYTLQQVTRLSGQTVGQTVASADDIKTEKHFRSGAYLHISIIKKIGG